MRRRIFIAINLPLEIKEKLASYSKKWPELGSAVKWVKKENLHITLFFLGYLNEEQIAKVCEIVREAVKRCKPFSIALKKVSYGPNQKMPPRLIWAQSEKSKELLNIQNNLKKSFLESSISFLKEKEDRDFIPHITLGRVKSFQWQRIEPEERPEIDEDIDLSFEVNSIEIMESRLKRGGAEYIILETCSLRKRN